MTDPFPPAPNTPEPPQSSPSAPGPQPYGQQPYSGWPPSAPPSRPGSGFAITALVLGIVGILFGLVPLTFWIAGPLGVTGLIFGLVAFGRNKRARAPKKMAAWGSGLSVGALALSVVGAVIFFTAIDKLGDDLDGIEQAAKASATEDTTTGTALDPDYTPPPSAPPAPEVTEDPTTDEGDESPGGDAPIALGKGASWEDGMAAVVRTVQPASFGQYATTSGPGVRVTVMIKNGTDAAVDLFPTADVRLGTEGRNAEAVYADGCDSLSDFGRIAPGRSVTATLCFAGRAPTADVSFAPAFDYNAITWTGKVG
jgi:hypothetical protein